MSLVEFTAGSLPPYFFMWPGIFEFESSAFKSCACLTASSGVGMADEIAQVMADGTGSPMWLLGLLKRAIFAFDLCGLLNGSLNETAVNEF